eukprot:TRINITY_DN1085_c0_g1_i32.p1 TRINITY_DN1085_c0_g1~~TRINITY_DN1085_c0_g1_i32.p1  ORF type:complete len:370 (+),score=69.26 TRINITY_DN1085_c0_g1_i32:34-1143(+)
MIRRPPRSTQSRSSAASDVYKRQAKKNFFNIFIKSKFESKDSSADFDFLFSSDRGHNSLKAILVAYSSSRMVEKFHQKKKELIEDSCCLYLFFKNPLSREQLASIEFSRKDFNKEKVYVSAESNNAFLVGKYKKLISMLTQLESEQNFLVYFHGASIISFDRNRKQKNFLIQDDYRQSRFLQVVIQALQQNAKESGSMDNSRAVYEERKQDRSGLNGSRVNSRPSSHNNRGGTQREKTTAQPISDPFLVTLNDNQPPMHGMQNTMFNTQNAGRPNIFAPPARPAEAVRNYPNFGQDLRTNQVQNQQNHGYRGMGAQQPERTAPIVEQTMSRRMPHGYNPRQGAPPDDRRTPVMPFHQRGSGIPQRRGGY